MVRAQDAGDPQGDQEGQDWKVEARSRIGGSAQQGEDAGDERTATNEVQCELQAAVPQRAVPAEVAKDCEPTDYGEQLHRVQSRVPDPDGTWKAKARILAARRAGRVVSARHGRGGSWLVPAW